MNFASREATVQVAFPSMEGTREEVAAKLSVAAKRQDLLLNQRMRQAMQEAALPVLPVPVPVRQSSFGPGNKPRAVPPPETSSTPTSGTLIINIIQQESHQQQSTASWSSDLYLAGRARAGRKRANSFAKDTGIGEATLWPGKRRKQKELESEDDQSEDAAGQDDNEEDFGDDEDDDDDDDVGEEDEEAKRSDHQEEHCSSHLKRHLRRIARVAFKTSRYALGKLARVFYLLVALID